MTVRIIGAFFIIAGCGGFGMMIASSHRLQTKTLRQLIMILDFMESELQYHQPPLPELCRMVSHNDNGVLKTVFLSLATELDKQISPNAESCMSVVVENTKDIPLVTKEPLLRLGESLGRFDLEGQLKGIKNAKCDAQRILEDCTKNQDVRIRCYQTLSICAGAAMAILFV